MLRLPPSAWIVRMVAALGVAAALALPAAAYDAADAARLQTLFAELKAAPDADAARVVADRIWQVWTVPSETARAERLKAAIDARFLTPAAALELLDGLIADFPDFAEAFNQRATLFFNLGNYDAALADIESTLALEPRHFGALAGEAIILQMRGDNHAAAEAILAGLAIHPFLPERALFPELVVPATP
jgi:tetratricopeptide (TPR) repeat protein